MEGQVRPRRACRRAPRLHEVSGLMIDSRNQPTTLCVILGGGRGTRLYPLTKERAKPAVPLGGKYRLIDVPISNCLNSGLNKMYVLTQFQSTSLHRHMTNTYRFDRFGGGFVEILAAEQRMHGDNWYQGTADAVRQNLHNFGDQWDEILVLSGDQLYRMDFQRLLTNHRKTGADMSIAVLPVGPATAPSLGIVQVDHEGRVIEFFEKPEPARLKGLETDPAVFRRFHVDGHGRPYLASMGIYVFNTKILYRELRENAYLDFGKHLFPASIKPYRLQAYVYDGYWEDIGTVKSFHEANLHMAKQPPPFSFATDEGLIYTRSRALPGTLAKSLTIKDSIVADGSVVGDAVLIETVLGIRSIIGNNVHLTRTLVMGADEYETEAEKASNRRLGRPDIGIGDDVVIENAIVDKNVRIGSNVVIKNPENVHPAETETYVVRDGIICIVKGAVIPNGTRIGV